MARRLIISFVDRLQERIKLLESQLTAQGSSVDMTATNHLDSGLSSESDRDHSAAAALSSLARVATPIIRPFHDTTQSTNPYQTPDQTQTPANLPIISPPPAEETYEWDEGGDEKEFGIDAMGAASTRDHKPGFFGAKHL